MSDDGLAPRIDRRRALALLGGAGIVVVAAGCASSSPSAEVDAPPSTGPPEGGGGGAGGTGAACTLTPEQTEGPYYLDLDLVRRDITEDRAGTPLELAIMVVDADACDPVDQAAVDVWHCDADGAYSGVGGAGQPANSETFLRGTQVTNRRGVARFTTIYPGWYPGRAVHIHVKVHAHDAGAVVHTGQLYFDPDVTTEAYRADPYAERGEPDTPNERDGIFLQGGAATVMAPQARDGGARYRADITLAVRQSGPPPVPPG